ncbi:hypothetical protein BGZ76_007442 [Entomortierella beljakovae]|nr:hypothetical protein BGZ76_007442 [Entomortierella beljakovae]
MSPVSRQAKLVHILGYVDRQRELVSSDDDEYQPAKIEKASMMIMTKTGQLVPAKTDLKLSTMNTSQTQQLYYSQQVPAALDPSFALPRALPRKMNSEQNLYGCFDLDIESQTKSDYVAPKNRSRVYESMPIQDWRQTQSPRRSNTFDRPIAFREMALDYCDLQSRPLLRQPTVSSMERSNKSGRLGGFTSFLGRRHRRQASQHTLQRKNDFDDSDSAVSNDQNRFMGTPIGLRMTADDSSESLSEGAIKPRSTVKRMFLDVFKKSSNKPGPEAAASDFVDEELHPDFQERKLFNLWSPPTVVPIEDEDDEELSSGDLSPHTIQGSPSSSATLRPSGSFSRLSPYMDDFNKDDCEDDDNAKSREPSDQLVPIAALIRELSMFGLDYINHNPCSSQREQVNDFQSAGNCVVAAM